VWPSKKVRRRGRESNEQLQAQSQAFFGALHGGAPSLRDAGFRTVLMDLSSIDRWQLNPPIQKNGGGDDIRRAPLLVMAQGRLQPPEAARHPRDPGTSWECPEATPFSTRGRAGTTTTNRGGRRPLSIGQSLLAARNQALSRSLRRTVPTGVQLVGPGPTSFGMAQGTLREFHPSMRHAQPILLSTIVTTPPNRFPKWVKSLQPGWQRNARAQLTPTIGSPFRGRGCFRTAFDLFPSTFLDPKNWGAQHHEPLAIVGQ